MYRQSYKSNFIVLLEFGKTNRYKTTQITK